MVRLSELGGQEQGLQNKPVDILFGAVRVTNELGGVNYLYFGFGPNGNPSLTKESKLLTESARNHLVKNPPRPFMFSSEMQYFTPRALEFREIGQSVDNPDTRRDFTEDLVTISCVDHAGNIQFMQIEELDILEAVRDGQINSVFGRETSYSLVIPDVNEEKLNLLLFSPENQSSNEFTYRTFLLRVIKSLVELDRNQNPPDQKGYLSVMKAVVKDLQNKSNERQQAKSNMQKIAIEMGVMKEVDNTGQNLIAELSVDQLRYVIEKFHEIAQIRFLRGKN